MAPSATVAGAIFFIHIDKRIDFLGLDESVQTQIASNLCKHLTQLESKPPYDAAYAHRYIEESKLSTTYNRIPILGGLRLTSVRCIQETISARDTLTLECYTHYSIHCDLGVNLLNPASR